MSLYRYTTSYVLFDIYGLQMLYLYWQMPVVYLIYCMIGTRIHFPLPGVCLAIIVCRLMLLPVSYTYNKLMPILFKKTIVGNLLPFYLMIEKVLKHSLSKNHIILKEFTLNCFVLGLIRLQNLLQLNTFRKDTITLRYIGDYRNDLRVLWKELEEILHEQYIILDCKPQRLLPLLKIAKNFKLLGSFRVKIH